MVGSCTIKVLVPKTAALPLFVELTPKAIDSLRGAVAEQIIQGDIHRKRAHVDDADKVHCPEGCYYSYRRQRLIKKTILWSPRSKKRRVKTRFHRAESSSEEEAKSVGQSVAEALPL